MTTSLRFLLLNQNFYPDVMATGQYLTEVAVELAKRGHQVTVVASRRGYDHPERLFAAKETWQGVRIVRIWSTGLGKMAKWKRAVDFGTFLLSCVFRLMFLPRQDVTVALTSPPLIAFLGALFAKIRGGQFVYWVMDLNPDEAIAAGWLRPDSIAARMLEWMSRFSFRQAQAVIALDRFMRDRIVAKGIPSEKVHVLPPWSHDGEVRFDGAGRQRFRKDHGLEGKFVVMYSGNHSPCHPLDSLLAAAERLRSDEGFVFCFVGGGSEWRKIKESLAPGRELERGHSCPPASVEGSKDLGDGDELVNGGGTGLGHFRGTQKGSGQECPRSDTDAARRLDGNIRCLPYQPLNELSASLSAADLHVVVMGDPFVGIVHPCKIYNVLSVAAPVLCIGPERSHLVEIAQDLGPDYPWAQTQHGEVDVIVARIQDFRSRVQLREREVPASVCGKFEQGVILPQLIAVLERNDRTTPISRALDGPMNRMSGRA